MILYKYLELQTGRSALENSTVRFTPPSQLNDPFETKGRYSEEQFDDLRRNDFLEQFKLEKFGVLSLSRSPLNPLLWSHYAPGKRSIRKGAIRFGQYGKSHGGIVIGIDVNEAGFNTPDNNVIPAKFGNVIYTKTMPTNAYENTIESWARHEGIKNFQINYLESLQRTFLYKSSVWSHEEEVRIVKNIYDDKSPGNHMASPKCGIQTIPVSSVKEIYIGYGQLRDAKTLKRNYTRFLKKYLNCRIYICEIMRDSWEIKATEFSEYLKQVGT